MSEPTLGELHRTLQRVEERQRAANGSAARWGGGAGAFVATFIASLIAFLTGGRQQ